MFIRSKILSIAVFAITASSFGIAQGQGRDSQEQQMVMAQNRPGANQPDRDHPSGKRAGDWLRKYQNLPPQEQERLLSNDPQFQQLPPERQSNLRNHLKNFNNLPPEKKQQMLDRMSKFENLSPDQRQELKKLHEQMHQVPENRREMVKAAAHNLREMSPQDRERILSSDRFRGQFSEDERNLIKGLSTVPGPANAGTPPANGPATPPK